MTGPVHTAENVLVVSCHPLEGSLCRMPCDRVIERIGASQHKINHLDLYRAGSIRSPVVKSDKST